MYWKPKIIIERNVKEYFIYDKIIRLEWFGFILRFWRKGHKDEFLLRETVKDEMKKILNKEK